jgi:hypothetical protein
MVMLRKISNQKTPSDITYLLSKTDNFDIEYNTQSKLSKAIFLSK